ncbi:hypothetical protein M0802_009709 [Mischocyttarus mexicanus]|nr:hypothetical protein M0802_009709 [Mischocyttarus mexicanus]
MPENEQVQKIPPPPPIYIENVLDIQSLTKCLNDANKKENYTYKISNNQLAEGYTSEKLEMYPETSKMIEEFLGPKQIQIALYLQIPPKKIQEIEQNNQPKLLNIFQQSLISYN